MLSKQIGYYYGSPMKIFELKFSRAALAEQKYKAISSLIKKNIICINKICIKQIFVRSPFLREHSQPK